MCILRAKVIMIFKKGDSKDLTNYRPISLLNSIYKLYASMIKRRLTSKLEPYLSKTQYGFRKRRSTAEAIAIIRRIICKGERATLNKRVSNTIAKPQLPTQECKKLRTTIKNSPIP